MTTVVELRKNLRLQYHPKRIDERMNHLFRLVAAMATFSVVPAALAAPSQDCKSYELADVARGPGSVNCVSPIEKHRAQEIQVVASQKAATPRPPHYPHKWQVCRCLKLNWCALPMKLRIPITLSGY